jgi:IMP dehydrogenase
MEDYEGYLVPNGVSEIRSRSDVDLSCKELRGLYPIISSPMRGVSGSSLVIEMGKNNCLGILHRFSSFEKRKYEIDEISSKGRAFGVAIGINDFDTELHIAQMAKDSGAMMIMVDVANGYLPQFKEVGKILKNEVQDVLLCAGNVVSLEGAEYLHNCGFDWVRVGIGGGSQCTTRIVTGVGRNQLNAIDECHFSMANIISDGGIDQPGKAAKSFWAGANAVMLGGVLARAIEAENDGEIFGMASRRNHDLENKEIKSIEGKETKIDNDEKKPLKDILDEFLWGIKSCCTYGNCKHYSEIKNNFYLERSQ